VAWRDLAAPYEAAKVRLLIGVAFRASGDADTAAMELDAARLAFGSLGAGTDLAQVEQLLGTEPAPRPGGLTEREVDVLVLAARGSSNRAIAAALLISEHTVARHIHNILTKLGVDSRTAASSFAYEHHLL
jgi:DNA-binding NarL/FixJ family response regulator